MALKSLIQPRVELLSCSQLPLLQKVTDQLGGDEEKLAIWLTNAILGLDEMCNKLQFMLFDAMSFSFPASTLSLSHLHIQ